MTLEQLRDAVKTLNRFASRTKKCLSTADQQDLADGVEKLSEYLLQNHAKIDRLQTTINKLVKKLDIKV